MPIMQSPPGAETVIDGRRYLYFAGTGYLGLQGHPAVIEAACDAVRLYGIGSATSRTLAGDTPPVLAVERRTADFFGMADSFHFASGYMSPAVVLSMVGDVFEAVLLDELTHYCLQEAAAKLHADVTRFTHCDAGALADALERTAGAGKRTLVMTDGVFSALGRIPRLAEYWSLLSRYPESMLLVDDAHGYGVLGKCGRGALEHAGLWSNLVNSAWPAPQQDRPTLWSCGTLSKALGGLGGIVPGSSSAIESIKSGSPYGSAASAPAVPAAAASAEALRIVAEQPQLRKQLAENVARLRSGLRSLGLEVEDSPAPIVAVELGQADRMRQIQAALAERGIWIAYVSAYSGVSREGLLRIAVFATHTAEMIDRLCAEMARLL